MTTGLETQTNLLISGIHLGKSSLAAVRLGLSRVLEPSEEDTRLLISQWEKRDAACCTDLSVESILSMSDLAIVAVSYKHAAPNTWDKHGPQTVAKMEDIDQQLLCRAVSLLGFHANRVMLWCDQVLSTRLKT